MLRQYFNKKIIILSLILLENLILINNQQPVNDRNNDACDYDFLYLKDSIYNELSEEFLNKLVTINLDNINDNKILILLSEEYQIFIFSKATCTEKFLDPINFMNNFKDQYLINHPEYKNDDSLNQLYTLNPMNCFNESNFQNYLHLFSIYGSTENNKDIIKLVIQTKKHFDILYYNNAGKRLNENPDTKEEKFTLKTNVFPYFINKINYEEYLIFKNNSIDIFNKTGRIFNDICYLYTINNETKPPELRERLYFYKYDNDTYPLVDSSDNCVMSNYTISYEKESFILEYTCKHKLDISAKKIEIFNISILSKESKENYTSTHSLKDQENILYCYKETFNKNALKKNVGFYISLILLFFAFVCLIILMIQKYEISDKVPLNNPPRKRIPGDERSASATKKKVNFGKIEILSDENKAKKKVKKKEEKKEKN